MVYSISSVLAVAKKHSFYDKNVAYPPDVDVVKHIVTQSEANVHLDELAIFLFIMTLILHS